MAYGDYQHCAHCDAKTFYDDHVIWDLDNVPNDGYKPDPRAVKSLCKECAEKYELVVILK